MSNLNQTQKDYLKTVANVEQSKKIKKAFKKSNREIAGLTKDQLYFIDNTLYSESAREKVIKVFRKENLLFDFNQIN